MSQESFNENIDRLVVDEIKANPNPLPFYISFANADGYHGSVILKAQGPMLATIRAVQLGIAPKGCAAHVIELPAEEVAKVPADAYNRLLALDECMKIFGGMVSLSGLEVHEA